MYRISGDIGVFVSGEVGVSISGEIGGFVSNEVGVFVSSVGTFVLENFRMFISVILSGKVL